jgi:predicted DNA-binding protein YlxM (UPF0122 family)
VKGPLRVSATGVGRLTGQQKGLLRLLREAAVVIGLAQQPGTHDQPGLAQQLGDTVRLSSVEVERDRVTQRLRQVQRLVADLERKLHVAAWSQHPVKLGEDHRQSFLRDVDDRVPGQDAAEGTVRQREALMLRYYMDLSEAETASAMRVSRGTAKSTAARGIAALRQLLGEES